MIKTTIFSTLLLASSVTLANDTSLEATILALDTELFESFNNCHDDAELKKHEALFSPDVEFYHDNGGVTWDRATMIANTRKFVCGKFQRKRVEETFRAYPIKGFGAISQGVHRFCDIKTQKCEGEADFVMIWEKTEDKWVVTRTLSFGHRKSTE